MKGLRFGIGCRRFSVLNSRLLSVANLEFSFPEISSISSGNKNSAAAFLLFAF